MHIVFLYEFNVQMFCEKLEFTNDQIRKYVLANNKFLGIIVETSVAIFMCFLLFRHLFGILFKSEKNRPQIFKL